MANKASIQWDTMDDLKEALRQLPADLHDEAYQIMNDLAHDTAAAIEAAYPVKTGNLKRGMSVTPKAGLLKTVFVVRNRAAHAWIYEHGTVARHYTGTDKRGRKYVLGDRGQMPAGNVFIPRMQAARRRLYNDLLPALLERAGLRVTGTAA